MLIYIRLVGEESDRLKDVDLDPQISLMDFRKLIQTVTQIPPLYQDVKWPDGLILTSEHPFQSIKEGEELVVKHALLQNWTSYLGHIEKVKQITTSGMSSIKQEIILRGRKHLSPLDDSGFFVTYPKFSIQRLKIDGEINFLIHNTKKYMKRAVEGYFRKIFEGKELEVVEKPKQLGGIQLGFFLTVKDASDQPICTYYAKTVGDLPRMGYSSDEKPTIDLLDLFVYQLFMIIGVGPDEVHIISDGLGSQGVYLATKKIENFVLASGKSVDQLLECSSSAAPKKRVVIDGEIRKQLLILVSLFCLDDLMENEDNYGVVEREASDEEKKEGKEGPIQELKIVDFRVNLNIPSKISNLAKDIPYLEKYFKKCNLMGSIDVARKLIEENQAIKEIKERTNEDEFKFYLTKIENNLANLNKSRKRKAEE